MRPIRLTTLASLVLVLVVLIAACSGGSTNQTPTGAPGSAAPGPVVVTLKEWSVEAAPASAKAGSVTFRVTNAGNLAHNFVVFKTDLAPDKLPVANAQIVTSAGVEKIGQIDVEPGATAEISLPLKAGSYVLVCNLPGHYQQGMHTLLTVEP
ncbi:MAG: copper-binding protein [Chloroflexi bacterium]|nr:copper-binding protein [Chloroflexota bacterium]